MIPQNLEVGSNLAVSKRDAVMVMVGMIGFRVVIGIVMLRGGEARGIRSGGSVVIVIVIHRENGFFLGQGR